DFAAYLAFCGIVLHNAQLYETSLLENKRNQVLLDLASLIFEEQQSLEVILKKIAATIISFMQVQKCTIFIVDGDCSDSFSSVFHMECEELERSSDTVTRDRDGSQINYMYAQYVTSTMEALNIPDVSKDSRFPWANENMGNVSQQGIRSLLCTPIKNGKKNKVIGNVNLKNKMLQKTGHVLLNDTEELQTLPYFKINGCIDTTNTQAKQKTKTEILSALREAEVLSYHASAAEEETRELQALATTLVTGARDALGTVWALQTTEMSSLQTCMCTIQMFTDLNLVQNFQMKHECVCRFVCSGGSHEKKKVQEHGKEKKIIIVQSVFPSVVSPPSVVQSVLLSVGMWGLTVSLLSQEKPHGRILSLYLEKSEHPLAQLYCHSTLEHHHFDQCLMVLNSPGNQILSGLSIEEYKTALKIIKQAILATDLALYIKRRGEFFELIRKNQFNLGDPHQKELFL
uniref:PDEase domain-containing protein n=1 Tax=Myotis lucifugus TaxID=59463 RepID=G1QBH0_MYOLU